MNPDFRVTINDASETTIIDDADKNEEVTADADQTTSASGKD